MVGLLENKVAIVTGASSGIGRAAAVLFSENGAKVAVADVDEDGGRSVVEEIRERGDKAIFVRTDVSSPSDADRCVAETTKVYGEVDCLFSNAGINPTGTVLDTSDELWERVVRTNLKGMFLMSKSCIPEMKKRRGGAIVCTSSVDGIIAIHNEAAYIASKGGVIALTRSMAVDYATDNIRVNCVCPGAIRTPLVEKFLKDNPNLRNPGFGHALGRMGEPVEVAEVAMFLLSDAASFVTGAVVPVDGGYTATRPEYVEQPE